MTINRRIVIDANLHVTSINACVEESVAASEVLVRECDKSSAGQLIENIQRMTMNPIEEARLSKSMRRNLAELARIISRNERFVSNRTRRHKVPKENIDVISQNSLKVSRALGIVIPDEDH